ncbi:alpha-1,2-mannosyltransferase [Acrasis kona]|uniref:Mannosyltransferase n=1 Tax=Acrasis kona TaxID=1008807 RepID=A0AAW2YJN2_9EUKA
MFAFANFISTLLNPIADCDETFNYWEPTHYVLYGTGLQTWEYSPVYALRSYLYIVLHAFFGGVTNLFTTNKLHAFYVIRMALGIFCALSETIFIKGVHERFGRRISMTCFLFMVTGAGIFNSSTSYLPSAFVMNCLMVAYGSWFTIPTTNNGKKLKYGVCILASATAGIVGWPFCVIAVLPLALDTLYHYGIFNSIYDSVRVVIVLVLATVYIDNYYYKTLLFAPLQLVLYNKGSGSELYGVEPWHFYLKNLFLNFNFVVLLAVVLPLLLISARMWRYLLYVSPFYLWLGFYSLIPHKEERFMYVVYPTLTLCAGICLELLCQIINTQVLSQNRRSGAVNVLQCVVVAAVCMLSLSRSLSMIVNYGAPLDVYGKLSEHIQNNHPNTNKPINVCVGKEWYRFPSHFFLPSNSRLNFLKSSFSGLLPKPYGPYPIGSSMIPTTMNDQNIEEMDRYVPVDTCDYIVDLDLENQKEDKYIDDDGFTLIYSAPFLDAERSPTLSRAFYIPFYSPKKNTFAEYHLLKKNKF